MYVGDIFHIHVHVTSTMYMGTDKVIFVGAQWGATGSHVIGTDLTGSHVTGSRVTGRFFNRLYIYNLACSGAVYD
jgi:hypothetical protein